MVAGAVSMLSCIPSSREICASEELLAGLVSALMASSRFQTPRSQQAISMVGLTYCMRFMRPPALSKAQVCTSHQLLPRCHFFIGLLHIEILLADHLAFMCHSPEVMLGRDTFREIQSLAAKPKRVVEHQAPSYCPANPSSISNPPLSSAKSWQALPTFLPEHDAVPLDELMEGLQPTSIFWTSLSPEALLPGHFLTFLDPPWCSACCHRSWADPD